MIWTDEQIAALKVEQNADLLVQLKKTNWTIKTSARSKFLMKEAAIRIEELEKYASLHAKCDQGSLDIEQKLVSQLRDANKRIKQLEGAVCQVWVLNNRRDRFKDEIDMVVSTAMDGETNG
jgi:uncharacterized protein YbaP (TraB family)